MPIINYGDVGDKFYIILDGEACIFKPNNSNE